MKYLQLLACGQLILVSIIGQLVMPTAAQATWSINIVDTYTKEVAVGIATCVNNIDLLKIAPVVVVKKGTGSSQSFVDTDGTRRATIFTGLLNETPPAGILSALELLPGHQTRQYGIADTNGGTLTFRDTDNFPFAGGCRVQWIHVLLGLGQHPYRNAGNYCRRAGYTRHPWRPSNQAHGGYPCWTGAECRLLFRSQVSSYNTSLTVTT